jgi:protein arginine kinase activator
LRESGLLGCGQCYDTFAAVLEPVFRRVQGHTRHIEPMEKEDLPAEVTDLRKKLARAIEDEAYEEAAKIRDRIRAHEAQKEGED